jgi:hypothetical protein
MKQLHRKDLFGWSNFDTERNLDFHSVLWIRTAGNIVFDPLPLSPHDQQHLLNLGGANRIIITNSDHSRDAENIAKLTGAEIYGPMAEQQTFNLTCKHWLTDGDEIVPGLITHELNGSKTPGELALLLEDQTLITGDLLRCHIGGELCLLPDAKLSDKHAAIRSIKRLATISTITTVLPGDGWPLFHNGSNALKKLAEVL